MKATHPVGALRLLAALALAVTAAIAVGCTDTSGTKEASVQMVEIDDATLAVQRRGDGEPLLLIHGAGEDASMLARQAASLADAGHEVITYDRRGTGRSSRENWPGGGADQHADDAAALLRALDAEPAVVLGVSSGGVIALALAARHPELVTRVIAWEPPAAGVLPGGAAATAAIMRPVEEHLARQPADWVGAQAILLSTLAGAPIDNRAPELAATRANAEAMVRDDPTMTLRSFTADELRDRDVLLVLGSEPNDLIASSTENLGRLAGREPVRIQGSHEVYLTDGSALAAVVSDGA